MFSNLLMFPSPHPGAQGIDTEIGCRAVEPATDISFRLQTGLVIKAPEGIAGKFFGLRTVAHKTHQNSYHALIVLEEHASEVCLQPMLGRTLTQAHPTRQCVCASHRIRRLQDSPYVKRSRGLICDKSLFAFPISLLTPEIHKKAERF